MARVSLLSVVESVAGLGVRIVADIKIRDDADIEAIRGAARKALAEYLKTEAFQEKELRHYKIATIIDRLDGVKDVDNLTINGSNTSVELQAEILPKLSEVVLNVG